jgi:tetratricopeptide (TPR) repeat protein
MEEWHVTELLPLLAWAHLELGELGQAADVVVRAIARAHRQTQHLSLVDALRVQALVAIRQEHWDEARRCLEEALALTRRMGYPYGEARVLRVYGLMYAHKGETEPAREWLEAARTIFRRLGARKDVEQTEQAIDGE